MVIKTMIDITSLILYLWSRIYTNKSLIVYLINMRCFLDTFGPLHSLSLVAPCFLPKVTNSLSLFKTYSLPSMILGTRDKVQQWSASITSFIQKNKLNLTSLKVFSEIKTQIYALHDVDSAYSDCF